MKAYTDILQSKKLAEILPLESADMCYTPIALSFNGNSEPKLIAFPPKHPLDIPCWSLSALLDIINENYYTTLFHDGVAWNIDVMHHDDDNIKHNYHANTPIDACVEMILELNERKVL